MESEIEGGKVRQKKANGTNLSEKKVYRGETDLWFGGEFPIRRGSLSRKNNLHVDFEGKPNGRIREDGAGRKRQCH